MSGSEDELLYNLLASIYRIRDSKEGEPLRALLGIIETEIRALREDIDGLYDDWFIETCSDWVIPYIGDCLGVHGVHPLPDGAGNARAYVANTLAYRRRKGTAHVLEQLARDVTGWPAHVVEYFKLLAITENLNHLRLKMGTVDLRDINGMELLGGPFENASHAIDVRRVGCYQSRYNIPNLGIFLWRLQSYPVGRSISRADSVAGDKSNWSSARRCEEFEGGYWFDPTGMDITLFNRPQTETLISHLSEEMNVPGILRRTSLYQDLEAYRWAIARKEEIETIYFGQQPVLGLAIIELDGTVVDISAEEIVICDLSCWSRPPAEMEYAGSGGEIIHLPIKAAVDPQRGRLVLAEGVSPQTVLVSYSYGFSGDVGAGPYDRSQSIRQFLSRLVTCQLAVSQEKKAAGEERIFESIGKAVAEWNKEPPGRVGMILIMDSRTYNENLSIRIPAESRLSIVAADWPLVEDADSLPSLRRKEGQFSARDLRPHLVGKIEILGIADGNSSPGGLLIDGLLIEGGINVSPGNLGELQLNHCTLVPGFGGIRVDSAAGSLNDLLKIAVYRSICGGIELSLHVPELSVIESIIDPAADTKEEGKALLAKETIVNVKASTVIGCSEIRTLYAENSIFTGKLAAKQRQEGCVRFSLFPHDSLTPKRFRCQPDMAMTEAAVRLNKLSRNDLSPVEKRDIQIRLSPVFSSLKYDDPGYAQLALSSADEILNGAEDGSEMGVFSILKESQRKANLQVALEEYLRFGLDAGIFYMT